MQIYKLMFLVIFLPLSLRGISEPAEPPASLEPPKRAPVAPKKTAKARDPQSIAKEKEKNAAEELARQEASKAEERKYQREYNQRQIEIQERIAGLTDSLVTVGYWQVGIAIIGLLAIGVAYKAASAAKDSAKAANKSVDIANLALNVERPYIFVESQKLYTIKQFSLNLPPQPPIFNHRDTDINLSFQLQNYGKGVAIIEGVRFRWCIVPKSIGAIASSKSVRLPIKQRMMGPGNISEYGDRFPLPTKIWEGILTEKDRIYIFGIVRYMDVFDRVFYECVRCIYQPPMKIPQLPGSPNLGVGETPGFLHEVKRKQRKRNAN